ncbi:hypothetical protein AVEN_118548-1 [Araneus ventricosus]|uniref:Uncharacterized protein n=1 Tax=Araneus ventricosus TaxID=182803 RepID=A0A4Y2AVP7_ARAVE|nr:hypothetical protein AVEN_118548-1 [Araneus ventricosus]
MSFARQACGKFAASSFHGDFEAFVNLLQACTLVMTNLWQVCCKLKLLSGNAWIRSRRINERGFASLVAAIMVCGLVASPPMTKRTTEVLL